jgi:phenylacetate-coenzyme A ligase PaaK-like adenylate-forming protein
MSDSQITNIILERARRIGIMCRNWQDVALWTREEWCRFLSEHQPEKAGMLYASSGTTGVGRQLLYSDAVRDLAARRAKVFMQQTPIERNHTAAVLFGYGMFPPAQFYSEAIVQLGCRVSPLGSGRNMRTELKCEWLAEIQPECIIGMPSYLITVAHVLEEQGLLEVVRRRLRCLVTGGELLHRTFRDKLTSQFGVQVYDHYGMLEAPMIAGECRLLHMHPADQYFCEVLTPNGVELSGRGVLVLSTAAAWGSVPMMRLLTGDEVVLERDRCGCGQGIFFRVLGRTDNVRKVHGLVVNLDQLDDRIRQHIPEIDEYYLEARFDENIREVVIFHASSRFAADELQVKVQDLLPFDVQLLIERDLSLPVGRTGKPQRFVDSRVA